MTVISKSVIMRCMDKSTKFLKSSTSEIQIFKLTGYLQKEFLAIRRAISLNDTFVLFC